MLISQGKGSGAVVLVLAGLVIFAASVSLP